MSDPQSADDPDWDLQLSLTLTPEAIVHTLFASAETVHTGWDSCVERELIVAEYTAVDESSDNHCRLVEQEYADEQQPEINWHDWVVELKVGEVYVAAHWRSTNASSPSDWDWSASEAESAFANTCVLIGQRVRRGLIIEQSTTTRRSPKTRH